MVGYVDDGDDGWPRSMVPRLGTLADLDRVVRIHGADVLLVTDGDFPEVDVHDAVRTEHAMTCDLLVVPRLHHFHTQTGRADHIGSIPVMRIRTPNLVGPGRRIKRAFDVVVSGLALLLMAPALGLIALAVRTEGPGVIFRQPRVGQNGRVFDVLKFRSMKPVDETRVGDQLVDRATTTASAPIGRILRMTSLDEIPQLWNILRGDMSLVGPRPERPHFVEQFSAAVRPLRPPAPRQGGADRAGPGERAARRHLDRRPRPLRQLLHRELDALARREDHPAHRHRGPLRQGPLSRTPSRPPRGERSAAVPPKTREIAISPGVTKGGPRPVARSRDDSSPPSALTLART